MNITLMPEVVKPGTLVDAAADLVVETTALRKHRGETDKAFVKRIVCAYFNAVGALYSDVGRPQ